MHKAAQAQEELNVRLTVRAVDLKDAGLDAGEIRKLFADREVRLAAGKACSIRAMSSRPVWRLPNSSGSRSAPKCARPASTRWMWS